MRKRRREREELGAGMMAAPVEPRRITPMEIQQKEFRLSWRGYNEREVDEFLDALTEELARLQSENVRLRSELETRERETRAAQAEAEATLRRAREDATRLLEEAELQARAFRPEVVEGSPTMAEGAPGVGSFLKKNSMVQAIRPFLGREREFLQSMARLIQEHADSVRDEVRQIREVPPGAVPGDEAAAQLEPVADVDRTALPSEAAPEGAGGEGTGPQPIAATAEPEIPRRSRRRSTAESERETSLPAGTSGQDKTIRADRAQPRDGEDGRRGRGRQGPVPAPTPAPSPPGPASRETTWGGAPTESSPTDVFKPKRRLARPPVSRLEEEAPSEGRSFDESASRPDLPATQPFEPLKFDERSIAANQPLETHEGGDEDERSLRELFWGEE